MAHQFAVPRRSEPYAVEWHPEGPARFIQIAFYKDGEQHRVWSSIGYSSGEPYKGYDCAWYGVRHSVVPGAFETQADARAAALAAGRRRLTPDW
jgi:hypothetical protein